MESQSWSAKIMTQEEHHISKKDILRFDRKEHSTLRSVEPCTLGFWRLHYVLEERPYGWLLLTPGQTLWALMKYIRLNVACGLWFLEFHKCHQKEKNPLSYVCEWASRLNGQGSFVNTVAFWEVLKNWKISSIKCVLNTRKHVHGELEKRWEGHRSCVVVAPLLVIAFR